MNNVAYDRYGGIIQLPLTFKDLPGIGGIITGESAWSNVTRGGIFYLEDHFIVTEDVIKAARTAYPKDMLPSSNSKLYAIVNGQVLEGKTKKFKPFEDLEDFVYYIQTTEKEGATVVSFGRRDFKALTTVVDEGGSDLWGISEQIQNGALYRLHIYGRPSKPVPPKYARDK